VSRSRPRSEPNLDDIAKCNVIPFPSGQSVDLVKVGNWIETLRKQLENISGSVFDKHPLPSAESVAQTLSCVMNVQKSISNLESSINTLELKHRSIIVQTILNDQQQGVKAFLNQIETNLLKLAPGATTDDNITIANIRKNFRAINEALRKLMQEVTPRLISPRTTEEITADALRISQGVQNNFKGAHNKKVSNILNVVNILSQTDIKQHLDLIKDPLLKICTLRTWFLSTAIPEDTGRCLEELLDHSQIRVDFKLRIVIPIIYLVLVEGKKTESEIVKSNSFEYKRLKLAWDEWKKRI
jgi:hypothetical protein